MSVKRIKNMKASATVMLDSMVKDMKAANVEIISLNVGESDFPTPENITNACFKALKEGKTKYTSVSGIPELKKAICSKLEKENGLKYSPQQIVVSTGAKQALFNAVHVLAEKGNEVIIPTPCWVSYAEMVKLAGAKPVLVETDRNYHLDVKAIRDSVSEKTRAIIINNPCNPTGAVYSKKELTDLMNLAVEKNIFVISDEVYEKLVYGNNKFISAASVSEKATEHCITINGFSKSYAMTGWRIGYMAAPLSIAKDAAGIQSHTTSSSTTFVQWAAVEALNGPQDSIENMRKCFNERRLYIQDRLRKIKGFKFNNAEGAFYLLPDISYYFGKSNGKTTIKSSEDFCAYILENAHVAMVPGTDFGKPQTVRIAYANSMENIKKGLDAVEKTLSCFH